MVQMYYKHSTRASRSTGACRRLAFWEVFATFSFLAFLPACSRTSNTIAVIPRACGTALWEPEHAGAAHVARRKGMNIILECSDARG